MEPELRPDTYTATIASELALTDTQVVATISLLAEGGTVPFIARYRKERTDNLDEVAISAIRDRLAQLEELDSRRAAILKSLEEHGHLNEDLEKQVREAATLATLEDIYLPYRPKRRTRATIAREKGLEPLADLLFAQGVHAVGGVSFGDSGALREALERRENWGPVGQKYELTLASYPGADALLAAALGDTRAAG